jgi:hypothetical protein
MLPAQRLPAIPPREQQSPQAPADFHKAEIETWWPIIKPAGIKLQ